MWKRFPSAILATVVLLGPVWLTLCEPANAQSTTIRFWKSTETPAVIDYADANAVELGLRFKSDVAGSVTAVRFYKGPKNRGTHVGNLWTSTGQRLASVTFKNETLSGWQEAKFTIPVAIQANTTYVISYFAPFGHYSATSRAFSSSGRDAGPLHAPAGTNGVYVYRSSSQFPNQTWNATNYWVDVVFSPNQTPTAVSSSTSVSSSLNPSTAGQVVTLSATVTGAGGTPTGTVSFRDGTTALANATLSAGRASLTTDSLSSGSHSLTVHYAGDSTYSASTSPALIQAVNTNPTTRTALNSSINPSQRGQAVTFTATVSAAGGTPTGSIKFRDGANVLGDVTLAAGRAVLTVSSLAAGTHSITAAYGGDGTFSGSTSAALSQMITAHSVVVAWAPSTSPNVVGYNLYRSTTPGGPYAKVTPAVVSGTSYTDTAVQGGSTYYYVGTAVSDSTESAYSNEARTSVPNP